VKLFKGSKGRSSLPNQQYQITFDDDDPIAGIAADDQLVEIDVVGESHQQEALERIAGARTERGKHHAVGTTLRCDPRNQYDPNAIRVECMGQLLGYIPRQTAAHLAPPLIQHGGVAEGIGVIVGGWDDGATIGSYGVRVWLPRLSLSRIDVDPERVRRETNTRSGSPTASLRTIDTGLSDAWATDEDDDTYNLSWYEDLPEADRPAIEMLRNLLASPSDPIDRHFQFTELERRLYHCRDLYDSALDEFDAACVVHDAEMVTMRAAFIEKWGKVPRLALYRQIAIRKSKAHDYEAAVWWVERGLSVYGDNAAHEEAVEDLIKRRTQAQAKLTSTPTPRSPSHAQSTPQSTEPRTEKLVCRACGASFERVVVKGRKPHLCPDCQSKSADPSGAEGPSVVDRDGTRSETAAAALEQTLPPAGWHPDPTNRHELRHWNGSKWTEHVADAGTQATDPV
jgi:hypothetical protein